MTNNIKNLWSNFISKFASENNNKDNKTENKKVLHKKPHNSNRPHNTNNGPGPMTKDIQPKKTSWGKIFLWLLLLTFIFLIFWSIFFTTPTEVVNPEQFVQINGATTTYTYQVSDDANQKGEVLRIEYKDSQGRTINVETVFSNKDTDGDGKEIIGDASELIVNVEPAISTDYQVDYLSSVYFMNINWNDTSSILYLSTSGGAAQLSISGRDRSDNKFEYVMFFSDNEYAQFYVNALNSTPAKQANNGSGISIQPPSQPSWFWTFLLTWLPWLLFFILGMYIVRKMLDKNSSQMNFGKSTARMQITSTKFKDVAGYEEIKDELVEVVDFLKNPINYQEAGARVPKGILVTGPPGTGKTLMAKAIAGEAKIPFFSISGSDFVEMFVGVGASRVRSMFKTAKEQAPCLIFIDELDAVGRQRGAGVGGGNDEREQTLNQLLVEMDGFSTNSGIVVLAATNRPDVLDPALKRPGRFDREVSMRLPDVKEREAILKVHMKGKKFDEDVDIAEIAERTPGFSGAQLENVINEATILSIRNKTNLINKDLVDEAVDRVIAGPAKKQNAISEEEKRLISYHEAGHAIVGLKVKGANIVRKITIVPRGDAGGYVLMTPKKEKFVVPKFELEARITSYMGGRAAEQIFFGKESITTGAYADIQSATEIARQMVTEYGMSSLGPIQFEQREGSVFLGREVSQHKKFSDVSAAKIDEEVRKIIDSAYKQAFDTVNKNKKIIEVISQSLMIKETLTAEDLDYIHKNIKIPPSVIKWQQHQKEMAEKAKRAAAEKLRKQKEEELRKAKEAEYLKQQKAKEALEQKTNDSIKKPAKESKNNNSKKDSINGKKDKKNSSNFKKK